LKKLHVFFVWFVYATVCFPLALHNIHFLRTIWPICGESADKQQPTKEPTFTEGTGFVRGSGDV